MGSEGLRSGIGGLKMLGSEGLGTGGVGAREG